MSHLDLAVLGAGNMGRALIGGLLRQGRRPERITVGEPSAQARQALEREFGVRATGDNIAAVREATVVVIAVKPQDVAAVLKPLAPEFARARPVVLSVAAGVRVAALRSWCGTQIPVIRAMPNRPALVGAGVSGLYAPADVAPAQVDRVEDVMSSVGEVVRVETEAALDVVTALSGSGPAYFFLLAELLAQAGSRLGLPAPAAHRLSVATLYGAGLLAHCGDGDLSRLRAEVTSKGGTTEAALRAFGAADLAGIVERAVTAAAARGRELAQQYAAD
jgi:pyrroline-5-carboxylate reductase